MSQNGHQKDMLSLSSIKTVSLIKRPRGWKMTAKSFRVRELLFPRNHVSVGGVCGACHGTGLQVLESRYCSSCNGDGLLGVNLHEHPQQIFTEAVQKEFSADIM